MTCCCDQERIIIVHGDDTTFNGNHLCTFIITSSILEVSDYKAQVELCGIVKEYDDLSTGQFVYDLNAEETSSLPYGNIFGTLRLISLSDETKTFTSIIPFKVIATVYGTIEHQNAQFSLNVTDGERVAFKARIECGVSVEVGEVVTLQPDQSAYVENVGTDNHLVLIFGIPQGVQGEQGKKGNTGANGQDGRDGRDGTDGRSAEMRIGVVETLQPTQSAYVINTGTSLNAVLDFGIPKGDKGDKGDTGNTGATGQAATVAVGTVTTLRPSDEAYVQNVGTTENAIFNFGIPKGDTGSGANADFSDITGSPYDCDALATVLNGKQNVIEDLSDIRNGAEAGATAVQPSSLAEVATSGSYNDLLNKPTIPPAQVNADWDASSGVAQILNKPNLATVATSGSYTDLSNKPTIPDAQVQSDWSESDNTKVDYIKNKPTLATVATSGSYNDLSNKPTIPDNVYVVTYGASDKYTDVYNAYTSNKVVVALKGNYVYFLTGYDSVNHGFTFSSVSRIYSVRMIYLHSNSSWSEGDTYRLVKSVNSVTPNDLTGDVQLATVASSGSYSDLSNKPTIPTVGDGTLTITQGGTTKGTFTANASSNSTIDIDEGRVYTAGIGIDIDDNEISVDSIQPQLLDTVEVDKLDTVQANAVAIETLLALIDGYDATKTQSLKNVQGAIQWVDD